MEEIEEVSRGHSEEADGAANVEAGGAEEKIYLAWEDLMVLLPSFGNGPTRRLLDGITGFAEPGRIMAIMGPSGSGKSTLLDALAGRLSRNIVMTGDIRLNGEKRRPDYGGVAYVTQEDILLRTLTVRETIYYSAHLRLPHTLTKEEVDEIVQGSILQMGLQDCADRLIGNWHLRGISGGERKRLSIALEILTSPQVLFLDEPTSGLDSASAFFVIQALRHFGHDCRTVICSIHQPSSEVFALFHDLILLSNGETVYFGEAKMAAKFFAEAGFPCPTRRNPSDHFLRFINSDFDIVVETLMESHRISVLYLTQFLDTGIKLKGEVILKQMLGVELDHSKWWDLAAVTAILIAYRLLFFAILKLKERASPYFRKLHTKRTLNYLKNRPSFRKLSAFDSKRHQVLLSLSSQEGLSSPIH